MVGINEEAMAHLAYNGWEMKMHKAWDGSMHPCLEKQMGINEEVGERQAPYSRVPGEKRKRNDRS